LQKASNQKQVTKNEYRQRLAWFSREVDMIGRASSSISVWRSVGFWMAAVMALVQATYALQAYLDPAAFAAYRGTPITDSNDAIWVHTYGSRTLFVALVVLVLLLRRDLVTLKWAALIGLVMPISDALVAVRAEASLVVVLRHVATGIYLLITFVVLSRFSRGAGLDNETRFSG
jgi:hypothetical protein